MAKLRILLKPHAAVIASPSTTLRTNSAKQSLLKRKIASSLVAPHNDTARPIYRYVTLSVVVFACLIIMPTLVHAHGGMGPDEIGPPIMTSGLIGFVSYWLVMLWPSSRKSATENEGGMQHNSSLVAQKRLRRKSARLKRAPRLRKIEGSGQFDSDQTSKRRANNG